MRILGIDMGAKRIGLAVSDPLGWTSQGLPTLENRGKDPVLRELAKVCADYGVERAVVGLPVNMNGSLGPQARGVMAWVPELEKKLGIPVITWDERLTSRQAGRLMVEQGLSRRKQREQSDRLSATILLQSYLDSIRKDN